MCDFKRVNVIRTRTHSDTGTDIETNTHAMYLFLEDEEGAGSEGESIVCSCDVIENLFVCKIYIYIWIINIYINQ